jgi:uncharacterized protein (DUF2225 family)
VAEINADKTTLITIKLINIEEAFFPNFTINHSANLFAIPVVTNMLAKINDIIFSHITLCPNCAYASFSGNTPVKTMAIIKISDV